MFVLWCCTYALSLYVFFLCVFLLNLTSTFGENKVDVIQCRRFRLLNLECATFWLLLVLSSSAVDADEAGDVRRLGGRSESARPADDQQACSRHGRSMSTLRLHFHWIITVVVYMASLYYRDSMARRGRNGKRLPLVCLKHITTITGDTSGTTFLFQCLSIAVEKRECDLLLIHSNHRLECHFSHFHLSYLSAYRHCASGHKL